MRYSIINSVPGTVYFLCYFVETFAVDLYKDASKIAFSDLATVHYSMYLT